PAVQVDVRLSHRGARRPHVPSLAHARARRAGALDRHRLSALQVRVDRGDQTLLGGGRMNPFRVGLLYFKVGVLNELQYRVNFFLQLFQSLIQAGTGLIMLALVYSPTAWA